MSSASKVIAVIFFLRGPHLLRQIWLCNGFFGVWAWSWDCLFKDRDWENSQGGKREWDWEKGITFELFWVEGCLDGGGKRFSWGVCFVGNCFRGEGWVVACCGENGDFAGVSCNATCGFYRSRVGLVECIISWSDFRRYISFCGWLLFPSLQAVLPLRFSFFFFFLFS